jgi:hypothetical protein
VAFLVALAAPAAAYPRFVLSTGASSCAECHLTPTGGGLLNDYGRGEAGDTISRGGDGALLHGTWTPPSWLALGGDLRGAAMVKAQDGERDLAAFPMQADLLARAGGRGITFTLIAGLRGAARDVHPPLVERITSREHYLMYQRGDRYARVGRFFSTVGLRLPDHTAYVRRYLGFGLSEEPYGLAIGEVRGEWDAHLHAFVPNPVPLLGAGPRAAGVAVSYERRAMENTATLGLGARYARAPDDARLLFDVTGRRWFEDAGLALDGEVAVQRQSFTDGPTRWQLGSYLGAHQQVTQGVWLGVGLHHWQPDLRLRSWRDAAELTLQYFPRAHFEVLWLNRASAVGNDLDAPGFLSQLQLHYYL